MDGVCGREAGERNGGLTAPQPTTKVSAPNIAASSISWYTRPVKSRCQRGSRAFAIQSFTIAGNSLVVIPVGVAKTIFYIVLWYNSRNRPRDAECGVKGNVWGDCSELV